MLPLLFQEDVSGQKENNDIRPENRDIHKVNKSHHDGRSCENKRT